MQLWAAVEPAWSGSSTGSTGEAGVRAQSTRSGPGVRPRHRRGDRLGRVGRRGGRGRRRGGGEQGGPRVAPSGRPRPGPGCCSALRELLDRPSGELAALITAEHGKVLSDAAGEVAGDSRTSSSPAASRISSRVRTRPRCPAGVDVHTVLQPLGVVAGITPFNFPVMVPLWMLANAIACGNAFMLKPSEKDPSPSLLSGRAVQRGRVPRRGLQRGAGRPRGRRRAPGPPRRRRRVLRRAAPRSPATIYETGTKQRQAGPGARRRQEPHGGPPGRRHRRGGRRRGLGRVRLGGRAVHGDLGRGGGRRRGRPAGLRHLRSASLRSVGPGTDPASQMGPLVTAEHRDRVRSLRRRRRMRGPRWSWTARGRLGRGVLPRVHPARPCSPGHEGLRRRGLRPGARASCGSTPTTRPSRWSTPTPTATASPSSPATAARRGASSST